MHSAPSSFFLFLSSLSLSLSLSPFSSLVSNDNAHHNALLSAVEVEVIVVRLFAKEGKGKAPE
jgi:hypothetical protein